MGTEITIYNAQKAVAEAKGKNYLISPFNDGKTVTLIRDKDFGNPIVKSGKNVGKKAFAQPILFKAGAEKIALGYGLLQHYEPITAIEQIDTDKPMFYYMFRCDLIKLFDGKEYVITSGFGSSNTNEGRNGFKSAWDSVNGTVKMAKKRALVDAAISIGGLSDIFTQDIENDDFMDGSKAITAPDAPESKISSKQIQRIFAIASSVGMNTEQAKNKLKSLGFESTKSILQKDYDAVCAAFTEGT
jgi:hypothetical protein